MNFSNRYKIIFLLIIILGIISACFFIFYKKNNILITPQIASEKPIAVTSKQIVSTSTKDISNLTQNKSIAEEIAKVGTDSFVVGLNSTSTEEVANSLLSQGFIQNTNDFISNFNLPYVSSGAY